MLACINSSVLNGVDAEMIRVEVDVSRGLPSFCLVGLPDITIKESRERVRSAISNSSFEFPLKRITVNLAPAFLKKEGIVLDLPIAIGILQASGQIKNNSLIDEAVIVGELSLEGFIKPVRGVLSVAIKAKMSKLTKLIVPKNNAKEAALVEGICVYPIDTLKEVVEFLSSKKEITPYKIDFQKIYDTEVKISPNFSEVVGQELAKRALEVAAAGSHNVLLIGPPGVGKTMLAQRVPTILPPMTQEEAIEVSKIYSVVGKLNKDNSFITKRPFRSPHHTTSDIGMIGGGQFPTPGEVTLSHNGVLFLDEFPEFPRHILEALRVPLEEGVIFISRANYSIKFPANFMLIAAMNPCPCGYLFSDDKICRCTPHQIHKYFFKISGPLLDRIDIQVDLPPVKLRSLNRDSNSSISSGMTSEVMLEEVRLARQIQLNRYKKEEKIFTNSQMNHSLIKKYCIMEEKAKLLLEDVLDNLKLSSRAYDRILKVARTIGDLSNSDIIKQEHIAEAINYRCLDRNLEFYL